LWDKDGTLLNTFALWIELERRLAAVLAERYLDAAQRDDFVGQVLWGLGVDAEGRVLSTGALAAGTENDILHVFHNLLGSSAPAFPTFAHEARLALKPLLEAQPPAPAVPGIREVLDAARALGLPQGVATADTEANARRDLAAAGLDHFGFLASSDSPGVKPSAWPVLAFADWAGVNPVEVLMIGDAPVDRAMAVTAKAGFVAVLWGTGRERDFPGARLVGRPDQLRSFFEEPLDDGPRD
jgi:HAD superfamily hydrolase (TIGR01549 family)